MSVEDRHWPDLFQEMLETPEGAFGEVGARDEMAVELEEMLLLTRQLQDLGGETMPEADAALARARERVLQSIPLSEPSPAMVPPPPFWQRWSLALAPALPAIPTALVAAIFLTLLLGATIYLSGHAQPDSPLYPAKLTSEHLLLLLTPPDQKEQLQTAIHQRRAREIRMALERGKAVEIPYEGEVQECNGYTCIIDDFTVRIPADVAHSLNAGDWAKMRIHVEPEGDQLRAEAVQILTNSAASTIAEASDAENEEKEGGVRTPLPGKETPDAQTTHPGPATETPDNDATTTVIPKITATPTGALVIAAGAANATPPASTTAPKVATASTTPIPSADIKSSSTAVSTVATSNPTPRKKATTKSTPKKKATQPPKKKATKKPTARPKRKPVPTKKATQPPKKKATKKPTARPKRKPVPTKKATRPPKKKATTVPNPTPPAPTPHPTATPRTVTIAGGGISSEPARPGRKYKPISGDIRKIGRNHSWVLIGKTKVYLTRNTKISGQLKVGRHATAMTYVKNRHHYATSIVVKKKDISHPKATPKPTGQKKGIPISGNIRKIGRNHSWVLIGKTKVYLTRNTKISGQLKVGRHATAMTYVKNRHHYATSIVVKKKAKVTPVKKKKKTAKPTAKPKKKKRKPSSTPAPRTTPVRKATPTP